MGSTPNLLLSHIQASQNQKEVTANSDFDGLDQALCSPIVIALADANFYAAGGGSPAVTNMAFLFTGTLSDNRTVFLPSNPKPYIVNNNTTGGKNLTFQIPDGSPAIFGRTVTLGPGTGYHLLYSDGFNVDQVGSTPTGGVSRKTANYSTSLGDSGLVLEFDTASAITLTLLASAPATPWFIIVKNINTGALTISRNGLTIDGRSNNLVLYQGDSVMVSSDGSNYVSSGPRPLSVGIFAPSTGVNNQVVIYLKMDRPCIFPASAPNSFAVATTSATGSTTYTMKKNGSSFGTIVFSASGTTGAFTQASDAVFAAGDILEIDGPGTADATLANVGFTLQGYRF